MTPLRLSVLPSIRLTPDSGFPDAAGEDFVDDAVVLALVAGPTVPRRTADPGELVLSSDDMDFAGWRLSRELPKDATRAQDQAPRRPAPPVLEEPGLGHPHQGSHRWWLAGLAGALSTMVVALLLVTLSAREGAKTETLSIIKVPALSKPTLGNLKPEPSAETTELTGVSVAK